MQSGNHATPYALVGRNGDAAFKRKMPGHVESLAKTRMENDKKAEKISPTLMKKLLIIAVIFLISSLAMFLSAHYFGDTLSRAGHSSSTERLEIVINNDYMEIPSNKIRFFSQRRSGAQEKIDLYMHWPSLSGYSDALTAEFNSASDNVDLVFLTIEPQTMSYDMSGRVSLIYQQFFEGSPVKTNIGLLKQALNAEGGFIDEDLYYAAASPYPFATRCIREGLATAPFCIRDIFIGKNLMVTYRFHKKHLPQWIELEQAVRGLVKSMIISPSAKL